MPATMNPYALIRRIIVAALTGTLPDEYRDDSVHILTQALAAPDDEVRHHTAVGQGLAEDPRLLVAQVGQRVVVPRTEGGLAVPHEQDDRHQAIPAMRRQRSSR